MIYKLSWGPTDFPTRTRISNIANFVETHPLPHTHTQAHTESLTQQQLCERDSLQNWYCAKHELQ